MPLQGIPSIMGAGARTAASSFSAGINFRATAGFVTDIAPDTYCLATDTYPTVRGGYTFGWESGAAPDARNRDAGVNAELAGINFIINSGPSMIFRFDLPSAGNYAIRLALGDGNGANAQDNYMALTDTLATLIIFAPLSTGGSQFGDAAGNVWTNNVFIANNVAATETFASTILRVTLGNAGSNSSVIAHLGIVSA